MKTIYKYELEGRKQEAVIMPAGAEVLTVQIQQGKPVLWALVEFNPHQEGMDLEKRTLLVVGTGHEVPAHLTKASYIGTYQEGRYVWHVFDLSK